MNKIGILPIVILLPLLFVIFIGLLLGSARFAIEGKGLFDPTGTAQLLLANRALTGMFTLNSIVLIVIAVVLTGLGCVLLILPGLIAMTICSMALWYLVAQYAMMIGVKTPDYIPSAVLISSF